MIEPIGPEAYIAVASAVNSAVHKCTAKTYHKQHDNLAKSIKSGTSSTDTSLSGASIDDLLMQEGLEFGEDENVHWRVDSSDHPRNWSRARKAYDLTLIVFLNFLMSVLSNAGTPAASYAMQTFHVGRTVALLGFTTIYLVGHALGIIVFAPFSHIYGRKPVYIASAFLYSVFNIPVAATPNISAIFIGRFITGFVAAAPRVAITQGSISDYFEEGTEGRSWILFVLSLTANLGLVVGSIFASQIAIALNWRWTFYLAAIVTSFLGLLLLFTRESNPGQLLDTKIALLQSIRPDIEIRSRARYQTPGFRDFIQPLRLLLTEPIVFLASVVSAFAFALMFLLPEALPIVYAGFKFDQQKALLLFLLVALGLFLSTLTRFYDQHILRQHKQQHENNTLFNLCPESKLPGFTFGTLLLTLSLWWFAWTVPTQTHGVSWALSAISLILLGYAVGEYDIVLARYVRDSYAYAEVAGTVSTATNAGCGMVFLQAVFAGVFPLFTTPLYTNLNPNIGTTILAAIATAFCLVPIIFLASGKKFRPSSTLASASLESGEVEAMEKKKVDKRKRREEKVKQRREHMNTEEASSASMTTVAGLDLERLAVCPYL